MSNSIYIKNMVCPRCIVSVESIFQNHQIKIQSIKLGEVITEENIDLGKKEAISKDLEKQGFEMLEPGKSSLVAQIKSSIIEQIHHSDTQLKVNFSTYLSDRLHHDYGYLSRLFSSVEGITIEKHIMAQKIEKVKELLFYDEKTLSQIAYQLNYSSVAHLSGQFKKETGMTPTAYKKQSNLNRKMLDQI